jgi:hypothetical protein
MEGARGTAAHLVRHTVTDTGRRKQVASVRVQCACVSGCCSCVKSEILSRGREEVKWRRQLRNIL